MIFGISGTKRTVRSREVSVRRDQTLVLWQIQTLMCYCTVFLCFILNLRAISEYNQFVHRRTGNFLPGGAVNYLPKKFSQVVQIFTKQQKRNEGHTMQQRRPHWHMKVARYCNSFSRSIPRNFEHNYVAIDKHLEKLLPQFYYQ